MRPGSSPSGRHGGGGDGSQDKRDPDPRHVEVVAELGVLVVHGVLQAGLAEDEGHEQRG
jgi:hypothetical protein